jgi:hypothetical protein
MFAGNNIASIYGDPGPSAHQRTCGIGRIVSICRYMKDTDIEKRLKDTIQGIDDIL